MEFQPHRETPYLQITLRTDNPHLWATRAQKMEALAFFYDQEEGLFTFTLPARDINNVLRHLLDAYPEADIVEVGLRPELTPQGHRRAIPGGLTIVPPQPGETPREGEIFLKSNFSFGSGYHPTTEISLKLLSFVFDKTKIQRVFDLGTGSGILALAAHALGAEKILAVDIDLRACREALKNTRLNRATKNILVACGSLECAPLKTFDLLMANLTIGVITTLARDFASLLRPQGLAILSGFTRAQMPQVLEALGRGTLLKELTLEGWAGILVQF